MAFPEAASVVLWVPEGSCTASSSASPHGPLSRGDDLRKEADALHWVRGFDGADRQTRHFTRTGHL